MKWFAKERKRYYFSPERTRHSINKLPPERVTELVPLEERRSTHSGRQQRGRNLETHARRVLASLARRALGVAVPAAVVSALAAVAARTVAACAAAALASVTAVGAVVASCVAGGRLGGGGVLDGCGGLPVLLEAGVGVLGAAGRQ